MGEPLDQEHARDIVLKDKIQYQLKIHGQLQQIMMT